MRTFTITLRTAALDDVADNTDGGRAELLTDLLAEGAIRLTDCEFTVTEAGA